MNSKPNSKNSTHQNQEQQNIEKPLPDILGIVFTPDTKRGRVMVRRNPRADATSYQRDDEYRVPEEYRPIHAERLHDTGVPSHAHTKHGRRDHHSNRR